MNPANEWSGDSKVFWGELAPSEHLVQIYEDDRIFLDTLEGFVAGGLRSGDGVIVIATQAHRDALNERLIARGIDLAGVRVTDQFVELDAEETLAQFMVNDWPDEALFRATVTEIITRARAIGRPVRAFGEMVAVLWASGQNGATVRLEHLWHSLCSSENFALLCAYPKSGFTTDPATSIKEICATHSRVLDS